LNTKLILVSVDLVKNLPVERKGMAIGYLPVLLVRQIFIFRELHLADKKQFSNTKSIVKVETGIVTLNFPG
jgi:hypothetical protein